MRDGRMVTVTMNGKVVGRPTGSNANQPASQPTVVITGRPRSHSTPSPPRRSLPSLLSPAAIEINPFNGQKKQRMEDWGQAEQPDEAAMADAGPNSPQVNQNVFDEFIQLPQSDLFVSLQELELPATQPITTVQRLSLTQPDRARNLTTSEMGGKSSSSPLTEITDGGDEDEDYQESSPNKARDPSRR
jgi:hypothetical protein